MNALSWLLALAGYVVFLQLLAQVKPPVLQTVPASPACAFLFELSKTPWTRMAFEKNVNQTCLTAYRSTDTLELLKTR